MQKNNFLGIDVEFPLLSGPCPLALETDNLVKIAQTPVSVVTSKSISLHPRKGNECPREYYSDQYSLNSVGIANDGIDRHLEYIKEYNKTVSKPIILNLVGFDIEEWKELMEKTSEVENLLALELNFSCPNHEGSVWSDNPDIMDKLLTEIKTPHKKGVKVNPCTDLGKIKEIGAVLTKHNIDYVVCSNTLGNCLILDEQGKPVIKPNNGRGGMGGPAIKPMSLSTVSYYRKVLGDDFSIIGLGGISSGQDLQDYLNAGANFGAVSSILMKEGLGAIERIKSEWERLG